jgi:Uma2 family endonuclease
MAIAYAPARDAATTSDYTIIPPPGRPWTEDDLLRLDDEDDGYQYELVRGELRQMSPASPLHGEYEGTLFVAIFQYLKANPLGRVYPGDTGFKLRVNPVTIRSPDIAFVAQERLPADRSGFPLLAPDLVVEIISPSETAKSIAEKVSDYLQAGTRLLWLVYPQQQEVQEYRPDHPFHIYRMQDDDELDGREVLPGFRYALRELFG